MKSSLRILGAKTVHMAVLTVDMVPILLTAAPDLEVQTNLLVYSGVFASILVLLAWYGVFDISQLLNPVIATVTSTCAAVIRPVRRLFASLERDANAPPTEWKVPGTWPADGETPEEREARERREQGESEALVLAERAEAMEEELRRLQWELVDCRRERAEERRRMNVFLKPVEGPFAW